MQEQQQQNEEVARHIWNDIIQHSSKPFRWGLEFRTVKTIPHGTSFRVSTDYIVGRVDITQEQQDCYTVNIKPDNFGGSLLYKYITSENLVSQIDRILTEGIIVENLEPQEYRTAV